MSWGKIYDTTWWGYSSSTWGNVYQGLAKPYEVLAEDGAFLMTENGDNIIIE